MRGTGAGRRLALDLVLGTLVPLGLARVGPIVERAPSLAIFRGRAAIVLVVAAGLFGLARLSRGRWEGWWRLVLAAPAWLLFAGSAALYGAVGLHHAAGLQVSGDEPHYLVMAQSLWRDHDLDLRDEYENEEWGEFSAGPLRPHWGAPRADGRPFPAHSPGLPLLLAPAFAVAGREGCVLVLALLAAAASLACRRVAGLLTGSPRAAFASWLAAAGAPLFFYAIHIYTEAPSALAVGGALATLLAGPGTWGATLAALCGASLPWLHVKMIPAAGALGIVALVRLRGRPLLVFVLVSATAAAALALYYYSVFAVASPLGPYGGLPAGAGAVSWRALAGLLVDRSFGLLPVAPVFLLALAGAGPVLAHRGGWAHALVGLAVLAPVVSWRMWWGGQCPPARFLVPMLPFLAAAVAARLSARPLVGLARWWPGLVTVGAALAVVAVVEPGRRLLLNRGNRPTRLWAALSDGVPLGDYLPTLTHPAGREAQLAFLWLGLLALLLALDRLAGRWPRIDRVFGSFSFAVFVLVGLGVLVDVAIGPPTVVPSPEGSGDGF